jgi:heme ABC exporter ATP-binding subunit CcmA
MALVVSFRSAVSLVGRFPALTGVDLDVGPGEVVLVRGPNGAGKTTLLQACAGLVAICSGEATVLGHDLRRDRRAVRARVGLLGHSSFLYDDLTVDENLRFVTRAVGKTTAGDGGSLMARLGLDGRLSSLPVSKLSAGQRRRVAVAAVAVRQPELWLLDEPHAGLDDRSRDALDGIVADAVSRGATVLLASHDVDRATSISTRQVTIAGGRLEGLLPPPLAAMPPPSPSAELDRVGKEAVVA